MASSPVSSKSSEVTEVFESSGLNLYTESQQIQCGENGKIYHTLDGLKVEMISLTFWVGRVPTELESMLRTCNGSIEGFRG